MSDEQKRFDDLMKKIIKVSPKELKRRLEAEKTIRPIKTPAQGKKYNGDGNVPTS